MNMLVKMSTEKIPPKTPTKMLKLDESAKEKFFIQQRDGVGEPERTHRTKNQILENLEGNNDE